MADTKISALTAVSSLAGTEEFPVVESSTTKKATIEQIFARANLYVDAADTLHMRNGATGQALYVYESYTNATNYSRLRLDWNSSLGGFFVGSQSGGTGTSRDLYLTAPSSRTIYFHVGGQYVLAVNTGTGVYFPNSTYDLGGGGSPPRDIYVNRTYKNTNATITTSTPIVDFAQTWNSSGVTFTALKLNITSTLSASASLLIDLQVGGTSQYKVDKSGNETILGNLTLSGGNKQIEVQGGSGSTYISGTIVQVGFGGSVGGLLLGSNATLKATASGCIRLTDNAETDFARLQFGGTSASFPALKRSTTTLQVRLAGDSDFAEMSALKFVAQKTASDGTNYERLVVSFDGLTVETGGTGADDIDLSLVPAGAGKVKFGSHTTIASETITGYITVKDSGGTSRKLAVVS